MFEVEFCLQTSYKMTDFISIERRDIVLFVDKTFKKNRLSSSLENALRKLGPLIEPITGIIGPLIDIFAHFCIREDMFFYL